MEIGKEIQEEKTLEARMRPTVTKLPSLSHGENTDIPPKLVLSTKEEEFVMKICKKVEAYPTNQEEEDTLEAKVRAIIDLKYQ